nr:DUF6082 family protein [Streptomyces paludis]
MTSRLLTTAVLSAAAVGVARLVLDRRHHRDHMRLATMEMHHRMLTEESGPELAELYPYLAALTEADRVRFLHCNKRVTFWHLQFRSGLLDEDALHRVAGAFMESAHARAYWQRAAPIQRRGVHGKRGHQFVNAMEDAFHKALRALSEPSDLVGAGA